MTDRLTVERRRDGNVAAVLHAPGWFIARTRGTIPEAVGAVVDAARRVGFTPTPPSGTITVQQAAGEAPPP